MTHSHHVLRKILFLMAALIGVAILYPYHDIQISLTQGDNGRDLYCFQKTFEGGLTYRDYWWVYGPLMPYYYSVFYKILGINIQSVILGKLLLLLLSGLTIYQLLTLFITPLMALIAAIWFWTFNPDFIYTYNHIGGIFLLVAMIYTLFLYIKNPRPFYICLGFAIIFLVALVKVNIGLFALISFALSACVIDTFFRSFTWAAVKKLLALSCAAILAILGVYTFFARGLPLYYLRQCFQYLGADHPVHSSIGKSLLMLWQANATHFFSNPLNTSFGLIIIFSAAQTFYWFIDSRVETKIRKQILLAIIIPLLFSFFMLHEFFASGIYYRIYWIAPFLTILIFIFISTASQNFPRVIKVLFYGTLLVTVFSQISEKHRILSLYKIPSQYLALDKAKIYVTNPPPWVETVSLTTQYLKTNLKDSETFFALPYDPLYYFLVGKNSPTRQLIFFDHTNISEIQEKEIIAELENKKVNYTLLSSRCQSSVIGLGTFGETYCPFLAKYLRENFSLVATFGDWGTPPREPWGHHGTKIFKRIKLL